MSESVFAVTITTALNYYKNIVRKNLDAQAAEDKIKELKLKRRQLRHASDICLYHRAQNVVKEIQAEIAPRTNSPSWHFGIADFMQYLQNTIDEHVIEDNKVIHTKQNASRSIVDIIQLITLPPEKIDNIHKQKLDKNIQVVARYGTKEQRDMLREMLKKRMDNNVSLFDAMLQKLKFYCNTTSDGWATV